LRAVGVSSFLVCHVLHHFTAAVAFAHQMVNKSRNINMEARR
jgi:hypothetical protein